MGKRTRGLRAPASLWAAAVTAVAAGLTFVPLFDLVGYELALALCPVCAIAATHLALIGLREAREAAPFSTKEAADAAPLAALLRLFVRAALRCLPLLIAPLVVMSANAFRVRNCNWSIGFSWYLVLPVCSAAFGVAVGTALGVFVPRATRPRWALVAAFVPALGALGWSLYRLYAAPPIFVFDPVFGYFAGSLYDEHVAVPAALGWARAYHAAIAAACVTVAALFLDGHSYTARRIAARGRIGLSILALILVVAAGDFYARGPELGFRSDAASIARSLGGERTTQHFVLYYRADGPYAKELDDVARELEFRYERLHELLGVQPKRRVHAYLFSSATEKQALMGAGNTYIAKPWRDEIYLNYEPFPQPVLAHELAHVFGAAAGDRVLGIARHGAWVDLGLVEGFAEAASWRGTPLTPDEEVRLLDEFHRAPALDDVMSSRFWSLPAQQAYAVGGSFCHFLLQRSGAKKLLALYHAGGARDAYPPIYARSFDELAKDWRAHIASVKLDAATVAREREHLLRPSIFHRPCAHDLARRMEEARTLAARGDHDAARAVYESLCHDEPDDPAHLDDMLIETVHGGHEPEARALAEKLVSHRKASAAQRGTALSVLGDLRARAMEFLAAAALYARAEAEPADESLSRLYTTKRTLAERAAYTDEPAALALSALARAVPDGESDFTRLTSAAEHEPDDALLAYLAARQFNNRDRAKESDPLLARALAGSLPDARFVHEAQRMLAEHAFRRHDYAAAAAAFDALAHEDTGTDGARIDAALWADRARYFDAHRGAP
jgi:hypothetical protein